MSTFSFFKRRDIYIVPAVYIAFGAILYAFQDSLIYLPDGRPHGECPALPDATVLTEPIRGYHVEANNPRLAIHYHGNAGNACDRAIYVPTLTQAGYDVLLVEYPGFAGDTERATTGNLLAYTHTVVEFVTGLPYEQVVYIGESIGGGFASYHATLEAPEAMLLIPPFDRLSRRAQAAIWLYPASLLLRDDLLLDQWAPSSPRTLVITAERDEVIPWRHTRRLLDVLPKETTTHVQIPHTTHNTLYGAEEFYRTIYEFLIEVSRQSTSED